MKKKKYIPLKDRERRRKISENKKILKEMEKFIKEEKGLSIKLSKVHKYPSEYSDSLTKTEFEDINRRARIKVKANKKRKSNSVWALPGGSTGLVQQKRKSNWNKVHRSKILNKYNRIPPFIKDKFAINAYRGIVDAISKIENKEWLRNRKGLKKQERYKSTLYRKLNGHIGELTKFNSNFKSTKLYKRASAILEVEQYL